MSTRVRGTIVGLFGLLFATAAGAQTADMSVFKVAPSTVLAGAGGGIVYQLVVSNGGPDDAQNASFIDTLPGGTTYFSTVQTSGPTFTCSHPNSGDPGGTVSCSIPTLTASASATFNISVGVPATTTGTLINTITCSSQTADDDSGNNSATTVTTVNTQADLSISKNAPATANAGTNLTYTITVANGGPSAAANVSMTDAVPVNTTFVSESQTNGTPFSCMTPPAGGLGNVTCTLGSFAPGVATFSITVQANPAAVGAVITNTASATTDTTDPVSINNSSTTVTTITAAPLALASPGVLLLLGIALAVAGAFVLKQ
jgi:uncharacterized repeat protein (TIGR01451 family)